MYEEYAKSYRHYSAKYGPDTVIFLLVGKFYELYDREDQLATSMKRAAELLGIQVKVKQGDAPGGANGLFAGVPEQSLHKYATMLTRENWTVVVVDQVKDAKGAVTERRMARILTPGTHIEAATTDAMYMTGLWLEDAVWGSREAPTFAAVALDLTTGQLMTYEGAATGKEGSWTADDAYHFFQVHPPRECTIWWRGDRVSQPSEDALRRLFGLTAARIQVLQADSRSQGALETPLVREELLRRWIPCRSLLPTRDALGIAAAPRTERALACLLERVEEVYPSAAHNLHPPAAWSPHTSLFLGNHALTQLNMVGSRSTQSGPEDSILGLFQRTYTLFGGRAMRQRLLVPTADPVTLERRYAELDAVGALAPEDRITLVRCLRGIADLPRLHRKIRSATITPADLYALDQSYAEAATLSQLLRATPLAQAGSWSAEAARSELRALFSIERAMTASEDAYCFAPGVVTAVEAVEADLVALTARFPAILEEVRVWVGVPPQSLRLEFREAMGPQICGPKAAMSAVTTALRSGRTPPYPGLHMSAKKSPALELPALETAWHQLQRRRAVLADEVRTALPGVCDRLAAAAGAHWGPMEAWLTAVDLATTLWDTSQRLGFVRPELVSEAEAAFVRLEGLRHPLIEAMTTRVQYVKHTVDLGYTQDAAQGWLVYGMNASGKSSLMKAVGIAVLLAQAGCYVPASRMVFAPFRGLYTRILNTDNLWAGLSSFAVEMTELREILQRADRFSLVLGDELCSGTESVSATALVGAGLQWLQQRGARFIFATHLHGLMDIPLVRELPGLRVWHLKVRYDAVADRLLYERTLTPGPGDTLYGLEVARAMNLPDTLLQIAHRIRHTLLGTTPASGAPASSWNGAVHRRTCELCEHPIVRDLEVHHIRPRAEAGPSKRFEDGAARDDPRNLIVVCQSCHDRHHAGTLEISPLVQTSDGPVRPSGSPVESLSQYAYRPPTPPKSSGRRKWTEEQLQQIKDLLKQFPSCTPKRLVFELKERHGIEISEATLRSMRTAL